MGNVLPPRILGENAFNKAISIANYIGEKAAYPLSNAHDWDKNTYYEALVAGNNTIDLDMGANYEVDTIALFGAHKYWESGSALIVLAANNPSYSGAVTIGSFTPAGPSSTYFYSTLTPTNLRYYRLFTFAYEGAPTFSAVPEVISEIWLGKRLEFPVGTEFSYDPDHEMVKSEKYATEEGRIIPGAKKYSEHNIMAEFKRLPISFVKDDLMPFLENVYTSMLPFWFYPDPGGSFGDADRYWLMYAMEDPQINLPIYNDDINFRNWTLEAEGVVE